MPATRLKNALYNAALPLLAPAAQELPGAEVFPACQSLPDILRRHHTQRQTLLLAEGDAVRTATAVPENALYRTASLTKMATAAVTVLLSQEDAFSLDDTVSDLLPEAGKDSPLRSITVRQLLSHTSGLRDRASVTDALRYERELSALWTDSGLYEDNHRFVYCNFGFGLLGSVLESVTGEGLEPLYQRVLFQPLGMRATFAPDEDAEIVPMVRVLPYHADQAVTRTALSMHAPVEPDPLHHFGYTDGGIYMDAASLLCLLTAILEDERLRPMRQVQARYGAISPTLSYGLGLLRVDDPRIDSKPLWGHQGFAYGCVNGAFFTEDGHFLVQLNGSASESREGRMSRLNRDLLQWAWKEAFPAWR